MCALKGVAMAQIKIACGNTVLIDDEDAHLLMTGVWRYKLMCGKSYVVRSGYKYGKLYREMSLARLIAGATSKSQVVDHINGDTLDNRRCNLRIVTHLENIRNSAKKQVDRAMSRFKGAFFDKRRGTWYSHITVNRKTRYLGKFENQFEAAFAYDLASLELHGEFGRRNFLPLVR
jgi:hypothetical protein